VAALPCGGGHAFESGMATSGKAGSKANARAARKARLAAALRENLKRRKQQARERAVADKPPAEASPQDSDAAAGAPDFRRNQGGE